MKHTNLKTLTTLALLCVGTGASAQESDWQSWPLADHFTVTANAFFPSLDTKVRLDASDGSHDPPGSKETPDE